MPLQMVVGKRHGHARARRWTLFMLSVCIVSIVVLVSLSVAVAPVAARISERQAAPSCRVAITRTKEDAFVGSEIPAKQEQVVVHESATLNVQLDAWGDNSVRIRMSPDAIIQIPDIQALVPNVPHTNTECSLSVVHGGDGNDDTTAPSVALVNGNLLVTLRSDGKLIVTRIDDETELLSGPPPILEKFIDESIYTMPHSLYAVNYSYTHAEGSIYGLGEHKTNTVRYPQPFQHLFQNSQIYDISRGGDIMMPWYQSSAAFAVLFNHPGYGYISINNTAANWVFNATHQLDIWVTTVGNTSTGAALPYAEMMMRYAEATSFPEPLPHFASGFWQSKDRYRNQSEVLRVAGGYSAIYPDVPLELLVIDWLHWRYLGDWTFVPECWEDPAYMAKTVQADGYRLMVSAWPRVDPASTHWSAMVNASLLTTNASGVPIMSSDGSTYVYDPFKPEAREYIWQALIDGYVSNNILLFWLDASEPERTQPGLQYWNGRPDREIGMSWPRYHMQAIFDGSISSGMDVADIIMLSRSTWVGANVMNVVVWSGDTYSTWDDLYTQVRIGQNVLMSGIWWWTTDIGGCDPAGIPDDSFDELLVRWYQFGAFCPIFRTHGHRAPDEATTQCGTSGSANELWTYRYSAEIESVMMLRESIRPYVEEQLMVSSQTGAPLMRPMVYDCADAQCAEAEDQYMFGPDWLVAPVLEYQATNRTVYLPSGHEWTHFFSNTTYGGGQTVTIQTTLEDFPLFQRVGATFTPPIPVVKRAKKVAEAQVMEV